MKILFLFPRDKAYNSQTVRELPCGGTEKTVIFLGEAFQKLGHDVTWATTTQETEDFINNEQPWDVVITQEAQFLEFFPKAQKIWWVHHFSDQPIIQRSAAYGRAFADKVVTLSHCQHDDLSRNLRIESTIIGHGVWLDEVAVPTDKDPYRLIYASTPFRGLDRVAELFPKIKEREPRATIGIASSMATYGDTDGDKQYEQLFRRLESIPGVELLGSLNQRELYAEFARASYFYYPCTWRETYCLVLDEALAHGCFPIVSDLKGSMFKQQEDALGERCTPIDSPVGCGAHGFEVFANNISNPTWWFRNQPTDKPKDWLEIAKQWEGKVLC